MTYIFVTKDYFVTSPKMYFRDEQLFRDKINFKIPILRRFLSSIINSQFSNGRFDIGGSPTRIIRLAIDNFIFESNSRGREIDHLEFTLFMDY